MHTDAAIADATIVSAEGFLVWRVVQVNVEAVRHFEHHGAKTRLGARRLLCVTIRQ